MKNNKIISEIRNEIKKLSSKNKFIILFLWLSWIIDFSIFINEDFCVLFFSNLSSKTIIFMMFLYFFVVLIETLDNQRGTFFRRNFRRPFRNNRRRGYPAARGNQRYAYSAKRTGYFNRRPGYNNRRPYGKNPINRKTNMRQFNGNRTNSVNRPAASKN